MLYVAVVILIATVVAIVKKYDSRMVLLVAGVAMACLAGKPKIAFDAFITWAAHKSLVPILCTVVGFTYVTAYTKCDEDFVNIMSKFVTKGKHLLIPSAILIAYIASLALPSAAGATAAVGALVIPLLVAAGIHPVIAAASVFVGTWGDVFSPGSSHNILIAKLANTDVMTVILNHAPTALICLAVTIACIIANAIITKRYSGYQSALGEELEEDLAGKPRRANPLKAIMPLVPLALILLSSKQVHVIPYVSVPQAMIYGTVLTLIVCRTNPGDGTKEFFKGMGNAYTNIVSILIAAGVFAAGMNAIGLTQSLIDAMKQTQSIARIGATFGPFLVSLLSGSGIAGSMAFNTTITPHAAEFGMSVMNVGSTAFITGGFGRSMSPLAAACIVAAGFAKTNPIEIVKVTSIPMILCTFLTMFLLLF
ncbi:MAG TPA: C4-dicarboxylate ABC transporter [Acidaminococcaceae bacterium]|nr:C4-dicarboxylate ABC transporter [Acidaminococcaceae bacterium]